MDYFAGLDVSMEETHICVLDREGAVIREGKMATSPEAVRDFLAAGPACIGVIFEAGRMAPCCITGSPSEAFPAFTRHYTGSLQLARRYSQPFRRKTATSRK